MATKWADYCVSAVRYNAGEVHIDRLQTRIHDAEQNMMNPGPEMTRPQVVKLMKEGKTFVTITQNSERKWVKGAPLQVVPVVTEYLKTTADKRTSDNLEKLPLF